MTKNSRKSLLAVCVALLFASAALYAGPQAQEKKEPAIDLAKLYREIAGDYDFEIEGQSMTVNFIEKDGKLFGAPVGETPEEILPVKGSLLKFEVTPSGVGQLYELEFVRNEKGVIDKCIMKAMGTEIVGIKRLVKK